MSVASDRLSAPGAPLRVGGPRAALSAAGFVVLFPGFLLYHYGVSAGWWPAALGGLFGSASSLFAALALVLLAASPAPADRAGRAIALLFFALCAWIVLWSLAQLALARHELFVREMALESVATVAIWIAMLFIALYLPRRTGALQWLGVAAVLFCFAHAFVTLGVPAGPFLAFATADLDDFSTYQGIGRSVLAVAALAAFAVAPERFRSVLVMTGAALLLLALGSRAHFFVAALSLLLHLGLLVGRHRSRAAGAMGIVLLAAVAGNSVALFMDTRAAEVLDLAASASWEGRSDANERALDLIGERPLAGSHGYHLWESSGYAHNILSAWTQYGLPGFAVFVLLLVLSCAVALRGWSRERDDPAPWALALHLNVIAIVLAIASEPVMSSVFPALAWGATLRALRGRR